MSKTQYWILNSLGMTVASLLLAHFFFAKSNIRLAEQTRDGQVTIANSRGLEMRLDQMAKRLAVGSEVDPKLKEILVRYGLSVTLERDGVRKTYP